MATNRLVGAVIQMFKHGTSIVYSATTEGGSGHANKNFWVSMDGNDTVNLANNDTVLAGELLEVSADGYCTVATSGNGLGGIMATASGVTAGSKLVGAQGDTVNGQNTGYLKNATATQANSRGIATSVSGTAKNSTVTVNFP